MLIYFLLSCSKCWNCWRASCICPLRTSQTVWSCGLWCHPHILVRFCKHMHDWQTSLYQRAELNMHIRESYTRSSNPFRVLDMSPLRLFAVHSITHGYVCLDLWKQFSRNRPCSCVFIPKLDDQKVMSFFLILHFLIFLFLLFSIFLIA